MNKQDYKCILIDERPYCFWGSDLANKNITFLKNIDCDFYYNIAKKIKLTFNDDYSSATLIRLLYGQALESLFSLLFGYIQSPHFIIGWLNKYEIKDIRNCINKINNGQNLPNTFNYNFSSWDDISRQINKYFIEEKREQMIINFSKLWNRLSLEFIDANILSEYNSIKHGNRIIPGGVSISIGKEKEYGVSPPKDEMISLAESKFGSTYYLTEQVSNNNVNYLVHENTNNFIPEILLEKLCLISFSINNIISASLIANNESPDTLKFYTPIDNNVFEDAFQNESIILAWHEKCPYTKEYLKDNSINKMEILKMYGK